MLVNIWLEISQENIKSEIFLDRQTCTSVIKLFIAVFITLNKQLFLGTIQKYASKLPLFSNDSNLLATWTLSCKDCKGILFPIVYPSMMHRGSIYLFKYFIFIRCMARSMMVFTSSLCFNWYRSDKVLLLDIHTNRSTFFPSILLLFCLW